jgi:hypothetical protein
MCPKREDAVSQVPRAGGKCPIIMEFESVGVYKEFEV